MLSIEGASYSSILKQAMSHLMQDGCKVEPRGRPTRELQNVTLTLTDPSQRYPRLRGRNANIFALIAETIWVISGRHDLRFIQAYLPRMADFSDDGLTLSGGYGPRIRNWSGVDQLRAVVETLRADPSSRRAVVALFDPARDHDQSKKDIPCCNVLHFTTSEGRLHLSVFSRSMDIMWGSAINFYEWTTLQESVAFWLGMPVGEYCHSVGSLHIYDEFLKRGERLLSEQLPARLPTTSFDISLEALDPSLAEYLRVEDLFRSGTLDEIFVGSESQWMVEAVGLTRAYWVAKHAKDYRAAESIIERLPLTEACAMALDQIAFMERAHVKAASSRPFNA